MLRFDGNTAHSSGYMWCVCRPELCAESDCQLVCTASTLCCYIVGAGWGSHAAWDNALPFLYADCMLTGMPTPFPALQVSGASLCNCHDHYPLTRHVCMLRMLSCLSFLPRPTGFLSLGSNPVRRRQGAFTLAGGSQRTPRTAIRCTITAAATSLTPGVAGSERRQCRAGDELVSQIARRAAWQQDSVFTCTLCSMLLLCAVQHTSLAMCACPKPRSSLFLPAARSLLAETRLANRLSSASPTPRFSCAWCVRCPYRLCKSGRCVPCAECPSLWPGSRGAFPAPCLPAPLPACLLMASRNHQNLSVHRCAGWSHELGPAV